MATFPAWNELPTEMQGEIRSQCCESARILLALTCKRELALLPAPIWPMKEGGLRPLSIDVVMEQVPHASRGQAIVALRKGRGDIVDAIMILTSDEILVPPKPSLLQLAYKEGHLSLVKCFGTMYLANNHYLKAFKYGHLHIIQWLTEKERLTRTLTEFKSQPGRIFRLAAYSGNIKILNYLAHFDMKRWDSDITKGAMLGGHVHILIWLFRLNRLSSSAISYGLRDPKFKWPIAILDFFVQDNSPVASRLYTLLSTALGFMNLFDPPIPVASREWFIGKGFFGLR
jgi:hypothetical protein